VVYSGKDLRKRCVLSLERVAPLHIIVRLFAQCNANKTLRDILSNSDTDCTGQQGSIRSTHIALHPSETSLRENLVFSQISFINGTIKYGKEEKSTAFGGKPFQMSMTRSVKNEQ